METSASFEARSAPLPYPTFCQGRIYRESVGNFRVAYSDLSRTSFNGTGGDGADPLADLRVRLPRVQRPLGAKAGSRIPRPLLRWVCGSASP